ncbi:DnaJ family molecular chaperone [Kaistia dalseonensis]|uniref:DnaJ like chaperone protein n=1 Tax=Kaistia dalseonensis TaxID=410840 RepID=A0ABU0HBZ3_9HYPH|nr:DnaJ family molecular chaperone [Kaistia dalseonensis]MCX5497157.1 DnaJ family molecular chaperone [Kaistia dalseonensis]MDQ0439785.1 DnaJ like chaperone protein [Kaistia dalseonensis]
MSIWQRLGEIICSIPGTCTLIDHIVDAVRATFGTASERRHASFSISMIALAAKMAKADGVVTGDEIRAFEQLFEIPDNERKNVARLFNLAKQDIGGFDAYARRIRGLFDDGDPIFEDIVDGLFHIAKADGMVHEDELAFLARVGTEFGMTEAAFQRIADRHIVPEEGDPYAILGIDRSASNDDVKKHYRRIVAQTHPDKLIARGVPAEFIAIATAKLAALNGAYDRIRQERAFA